MLEILLAGGWAMAPILLCSAVAVAIILERFWSLRRTTVIPANHSEEPHFGALDVAVLGFVGLCLVGGLALLLL